MSFDVGDVIRGIDNDYSDRVVISVSATHYISIIRNDPEETPVETRKAFLEELFRKLTKLEKALL